MRRYLLLLVPLCINLHACVFNSDQPSIDSNFSANQSFPATRNFCDNVVNDCGSTFSPTYCEFSSPPITGQKFSSRGKNPCIAKQELFKKLCAKKMDPERQNLMHCAPDPTVGECEDLALEECSQETKPMFCLATKYNDRTIAAIQAPKSWGKNLCEASNALLVASCRSQLRPSMISELRCEPSKLTEKCPIPPSQCDEKYAPSRCRIKLEDLEKTLSSVSENECLAKHQLQQQLCQLELNPDRITDAECTEPNSR